MSANKKLNAAKDAKKDEFYTQRTDIENELSHYAEHFKGKVVYCNCDDPKESEFWQFFVRVFNSWGIKKLIATHYDPNELNYTYKLEAQPDETGKFGVQNEPEKTPLPCNGDFRSAACIELLKEADIVVTNPPFSLFREYIAQLMEYNKKFLIIGHQNAVKYKEIFPLIKNEHIWLGYGFPGNVGFFRAPNYEDYAVSSQHKEGLIRVSGVMWFTNLDIPKRHQPMDLRGNYYEGNEELYPEYDNFNAIDVSKANDIPCDYYGMMGVPITFLSKYCPDQFELIGMGTGDTAKLIGVQKNYRGRTDLSITVNGKSSCPYTRIIIKRKGEPS